MIRNILFANILFLALLALAFAQDAQGSQRSITATPLQSPIPYSVNTITFEDNQNATIFYFEGAGCEITIQLHFYADVVVWLCGKHVGSSIVATYENDGAKATLSVSESTGQYVVELKDMPTMTHKFKITGTWGAL